MGSEENIIDQAIDLTAVKELIPIFYEKLDGQNMRVMIGLVLTLVDDMAHSYGLDPKMLMHMLCDLHDQTYDEVEKIVKDSHVPEW